MWIGLLLSGFFTFVELNCENLFDCMHDSLKHDEEFLPDGSHHWTTQRYWRKLNALGQEIIACGSLAPDTFIMSGPWKRDWQLPALVGLCEVENDSCVYALTQRSLLRNAAYQYVMTHSPDQRGIDVALLYSPYSFWLLGSHSYRVPLMGDMRPTRDILYAYGEVAGGDTLHVFVVHAPSRSGSAGATERYRLRVADRVCMVIDSIRVKQPQAKIIVAGDMNAYTNEKSIRRYVQEGMVDVSAGAVGNHGAKGTYRYQGEWGSLDHIMVSESLIPHFQRCYIFDAPFLLEEDERYGGVKPFRTYLGPKYKGGFSDHLPLVARFQFE